MWHLGCGRAGRLLRVLKWVRTLSWWEAQAGGWSLACYDRAEMMAIRGRRHGGGRRRAARLSGRGQFPNWVP